MSIITPALIDNGTITTDKIADNAINSAKIAHQSIYASDIKDGQIIDAKIDTVNGNKIMNLTISGDKLELNSISTLKIVDGNVTNAKLANDSVTIAGNTVALGASTDVSIFDLSDVSGDAGAGKLLVGTGSSFSAVSVDTDDFTEGSTNLFHTTQRAYDSVVTNFDAFDVGAYDSTGIQIKNDGTRWPVIEVRQYGAGPFGANNPGFFALSTGGTESSPTALGDDARMFVIGASAHNGSIPSTTNTQISAITTEAQTSSARGAEVTVETTANGATSRTTTATFHGNDTTLINLIASGTVVLSNLPTADPTNAGQLWNDSGTLKVSAG